MGDASHEMAGGQVRPFGTLRFRHSTAASGGQAKRVERRGQADVTPRFVVSETRHGWDETERGRDRTQTKRWNCKLKADAGTEPGDDGDGNAKYKTPIESKKHGTHCQTG